MSFNMPAVFDFGIKTSLDVSFAPNLYNTEFHPWHAPYTAWVLRIW